MLSTSLSLLSLDHKLSRFESLPNVAFGTVLDQLNRMTGSNGIVNDSDIPVIMKNVFNLACTSKTLYRAVNNSIVTKALLDSLARKYLKTPRYLAAKLDTVGARKWIWDYIHINKFHETYAAIQEIYKLAADVQKEANKANLKFKMSEGRKGWPSPNPFYYQTKTGFLLHASTSPHALSTPFGEIKIYGGGLANDSLSILEIFIKQLDATFEEMSFGGCRKPADREQNYKILISDLKSKKLRKLSFKDGIKISEAELEKEKDSHNIIFNSYCGNDSVYKIRRVGNQVMPEVTYHAKNSQLEYEFVNTMWEMLEKARLGKNPIAKEIVKKDIRMVSAETSRPRTFSEITQKAIHLIEELSQQPLFPEKRWISTPSKVLPLKNYSDARCVELLNDASKKFLEKDAHWHIRAFGCGNDRISLKGKDLGDGLEIWLYDTDKTCSLATLKSAYDSVLSQLGLNWDRANLKDYPNILHTESEENFILFIKEIMFPGEECLLRFIADEMGLSKYIKVSSYWKNKSGPDRSQLLYIWVKKDKFDEVRKKFNLRRSEL